eukprot:gb/GEZN01021259.1/.p1 GENE.gb/GEZN01021259.1/~~gb/GEZN01021259.1/.p1  ORF type:complete len:113 (+),score=20.69 gb/GEZN01021259.1/:106-444(+)
MSDGKAGTHKPADKVGGKRVASKKHPAAKEPTEDEQVWQAEEEALVAKDNAKSLSQQLFGVDEASHAQAREGLGSKAVASTYQPAPKVTAKHDKQILRPNQPGGRGAANHQK